RNMRIQAPTWLKPRNKKMFILEIMSIIMVLPLNTGGILFQVDPLFRKHVLCPFCVTTETLAHANVYMISHRELLPSMFASETFLYTLDAQTGKVKHTADLNKIGRIYYQKVINGISYEVVSDGIG